MSVQNLSKPILTARTSLGWLICVNFWRYLVELIQKSISVLCAINAYEFGLVDGGRYTNGETLTDNRVGNSLSFFILLFIWFESISWDVRAFDVNNSSAVLLFADIYSKTFKYQTKPIIRIVFEIVWSILKKSFWKDMQKYKYIPTSERWNF